QAMQEQLGTLSGRVQETLAGMAAIRAYTMEHRAAATFAAANRTLLERSVAVAAIQARFTPLMSLIAGVGVLVVIWVGGRDVALAVAPGEMVAVVGPTGAGKSTLGLLLARLWEPPAGTVFVGGRDVTTLPLATLRATVGWVPQEALLFSRSIADNITLGRAG